MPIDDLEDLHAAVDPAAARVLRTGVRRRAHREATKDDAPRIGADEAGDAAETADVAVPGTARIYLKTYGCSHNSSDSEVMAGQLQQFGYRLVGEADREVADLWLINSCTVKNPSQEHMATDLKRGRALGKALVVAGCVSQAEPDLDALAGLSIIGVQQIDRVVEVVQEALRGHTVRLLGRGTRPSLELPKVRRNPLIEIVACNTGCLGSCTYCKTVYARGRLGSYSPDALVQRLRSALLEGVVEVWLTSEDTGAYGRDIGSSMPELLGALLEGVPEGCMLRVGMTNPPYMREHLPAIAALLNHPRCYAFLHIPVQSGSDRVLHAMRREYTAAEFREVADALLAAVPGLTIATDIICGFPGETESDHAETLRLVQQYRFPVLNISQFYPRPGTPAARLPRIATHVVKERTREVSALFASYTTLDGLVGTEQRVLVTEVASDGVHLVGHTKGYAQVLLPAVAEHMGCTLRVLITSAAKFYCKADVLEVLHLPSHPEVAAKVVGQAHEAKEHLGRTKERRVAQARAAPMAEAEVTSTPQEAAAVAARATADASEAIAEEETAQAAVAPAVAPAAWATSTSCAASTECCGGDCDGGNSSTENACACHEQPPVEVTASLSRGGGSSPAALGGPAALELERGGPALWHTPREGRVVAIAVLGCVLVLSAALAVWGRGAVRAGAPR
jgi:threonylcarbamoyladenosine tRNA methylthiotransferase CDKAL1